MEITPSNRIETYLDEIVKLLEKLAGKETEKEGGAEDEENGEQ